MKKSSKQILFERMGRLDPSFKTRVVEETPSGKITNGEILEMLSKSKSFNKKLNITESNEYQNSGNTQDPSYDDMMSHLKNKFNQMGFDEFDAEAAIFWFAYDYHGGQNSNMYSALSISQYKPGRLVNKIESEGELATEMYNELEREYYSNDVNEEQLGGENYELFLKDKDNSVVNEDSFTTSNEYQLQNPVSVGDNIETTEGDVVRIVAIEPEKQLIKVRVVHSEDNKRKYETMGSPIKDFTTTWTYEQFDHIMGNNNEEY